MPVPPKDNNWWCGCWKQRITCPTGGNPWLKFTTLSPRQRLKWKSDCFMPSRPRRAYLGHDLSGHDATRHITTQHDTTRHETMRHETTGHELRQVCCFLSFVEDVARHHYETGSSASSIEYSCLSAMQPRINSSRHKTPSLFSSILEKISSVRACGDISTLVSSAPSML